MKGRRGVSTRKVGRTSRYRGVTLFAEQRKYQAFVKVRGKRIHLGMWRDEKDAAVARDRAVLFFGLETPLNLPRGARKLGAASPGELRRVARERKKRADNTSPYLGVTWNPVRSRWDAMICVGNKRVTWIAQFDRAEDAAVAYDRVARHVLGKRASLNFPERRLRPATVREMRAWTRRIWKEKTSSRYRGVTLLRRDGGWRAQIHVRGQVYRMGVFDSEEPAAVAYDKAAVRFFGKKAVLNFP